MSADSDTPTTGDTPQPEGRTAAVSGYGKSWDPERLAAHVRYLATMPHGEDFDFEGGGVVDSIRAKTVAVWTSKGGVGKTKNAFDLAGMAALSGWRVLLVDLDEQGSLTRLTSADAEDRFDEGASIHDALLNGLPLSVHTIRQMYDEDGETPRGRVDLVPGGNVLRELRPELEAVLSEVYQSLLDNSASQLARAAQRAEWIVDHPGDARRGADGTIDWAVVDAKIEGRLEQAKSDLIENGSLTAFVPDGRRLLRALEPIADDYDVILLDAGPTTAEPSTQMLVASGAVIVPLNVDAETRHGLLRFVKARDLLADASDNPMLRTYHNPHLHLAAVMPTAVNLQHTAYSDLKQWLIENLPSGTAVAPPIVESVATATLQSNEHAFINDVVDAINVLQAARLASFKTAGKTPTTVPAVAVDIWHGYYGAWGLLSRFLSARMTGTVETAAAAAAESAQQGIASLENARAERLEKKKSKKKDANRG